MIEVQHLTLWQYLTFLRVRHHRVDCPTCGLTLESLPFVAEGARVTPSLASLVAELCKVMTVKAVAIFQSLHRGTVKTIDKLALEREQASRPLDGITVLGIDEIAVGKGQTYWHLVSALEGPRGPELLFVGEGRREKHLVKFWKWFGKDRARGITHAVMDMWKPFRNSFLAKCPEVKIIYDKFHVMQHLLKALNEVRKQELRKAAGRFRGRLAGKKFILLSRGAHVRGNARKALNALLNANRKLFKAHLLKESFDHLWSYSSKTWATKFFRHWVEQLKWSRLKPYYKFAEMIENHLDGMLNHCDKKVSLGFVESANLKARNVIRMAYGYRDKEYMKLKIIQTCTPWMREFNPWIDLHNNSS
jgi:transposase